MTMRAAAGCKSSRSKGVNSYRRPIGSARIRKSWPWQSKRRNKPDHRRLIIGGFHRGRGTMRRLQRVALAFGACAAAGLGIASDGAAQQKEVVVGQMCDRTGP